MGRTQCFSSEFTMLHSFFTHKAFTKLCEGHIWGPSLHDQEYQWQSQYLSPNARLDTSLQGQRTRHEAITPPSNHYYLSTGKKTPHLWVQSLKLLGQKPTVNTSPFYPFCWAFLLKSNNDLMTNLTKILHKLDCIWSLSICIQNKPVHKKVRP